MLCAYFTCVAALFEPFYHSLCCEFGRRAFPSRLIWEKRDHEKFTHAKFRVGLLRPGFGYIIYSWGRKSRGASIPVDPHLF